jgi:hypothetical protein
MKQNLLPIAIAVVLIIIGVWYIVRRSKRRSIRGRNVLRDDWYHPKKVVRVTVDEMLNFKELPYNFNNIQRVEHVYLLADENLTFAEAYIECLNIFLKNAPQLTANKMPEFRISNIRTNPQNYDYGYMDFSYLSINPYTKTGRVSKYPLSLHFCTHSYKEEETAAKYIRGDIQYLENGEIGKCEISCNLKPNHFSVGLKYSPKEKMPVLEYITMYNNAQGIHKPLYRRTDI